MVIKMKLVKTSSGFSLLELLMVVTVVAVLAAVAVPSFRGIINNQRIKNASFELFASLLLTRSEAIKRNDDVTIAAVSGGWQEGWQITAADGTVIKAHGALNQVVVSNAPTSLVYRRTGRLSATAPPSFQMDINPSNVDYIRCISIQLSGLPKTAKGACT